MVGKTDQANHLYDLTWFWDAARAGSLPAVSFLKAPAYQNGHPGNSDPLDEQTFLVTTLNRLQRLPEWTRMVVIIAWDDSDGWYDHVMPPIVNRSSTPLDFLCGSQSDGPGARCGYGPRLPLLIVSPYAKRNYVSHALSDQTSVLRFIEDIWLDGARVSEISFDRRAGSLLDMFDLARRVTRRLRLDPTTGLRAGRGRSLLAPNPGAGTCWLRASSAGTFVPHQGPEQQPSRVSFSLFARARGARSVIVRWNVC
jgi:phospholipase C